MSANIWYLQAWNLSTKFQISRSFQFFFVYQAQMDHFGHNCPLHIVQQLYVQAMAMSVYGMVSAI